MSTCLVMMTIHAERIGWEIQHRSPMRSYPSSVESLSWKWSVELFIEEFASVVFRLGSEGKREGGRDRITTWSNRIVSIRKWQILFTPESRTPATRNLQRPQ